MRPVARAPPHGYPRGAALDIERNLCLHRGEVDGAALPAHPLAQRADLVERAEKNVDLGGAPGRAGKLPRAGAAVEKGVDLVIAQPSRRPDGRRHRPGGDDPAPGVQAGDNGHREAVLPRSQRAHVVGEALRQHGYDAVREIRRAPACARLAIHRVTRAHVVRDVGDVNPELVASSREAPGAHGVVEVARIGWVDGHAELVAQVAAARAAGQLLVDARLNPLGGRKDGRGEVAGQAEGGDHRLHVEVNLVGRPHASLDGHHGGALPRGVLGDSRHHHVAGGDAEPARARVLGHHEEVMPQPRIERDHRAKRSGELEASEEGLRRAGHHGANDGARGTVAGAHDRDLDLVPVHGLTLTMAHELEGALLGLDPRHARP